MDTQCADFLTHRAVMNELKLAHKMIAAYLHNQSFVYFDLPVYDNVGDLLIMEGTFQFFKDYDLTPRIIGSAYSPLVGINSDDVIVLQGGGNLGDLYPLHQDLRQRIIERFPDNKIIILPQTIYFSSEEAYRQCCDCYLSHANLYIFVRDVRSYGLAEKMTSKVHLCSDMAHSLYGTDLLKLESGDATGLELYIQRQDIESIEQQDCSGYSESVDWSDITKRMQSRIIWTLRVLKLLRKLNLLNGLVDSLFIKCWRNLALKLIDESVRYYSRYDIIYTNRLHGHILAALMNKRSIVLDNSYGKNQSYVKAWTSTSPLVMLGGEQ